MRIYKILLSAYEEKIIYKANTVLLNDLDIRKKSEKNKKKLVICALNTAKYSEHKASTMNSKHLDYSINLGMKMFAEQVSLYFIKYHEIKIQHFFTFK